jgi:DNA (cytosine-5)-methyltransferase 1
MKVLELFAGIGGIGLGLERTGEFKVHWQVEIEPYARKVLQKHWPDAYLHDDVKTFPPADLHCDADVIAGGFPCQDISTARKGEGLKGERSGLFFEVVRIAKEIKPRWILLENVSALLVRGLDRVLGELAKIRYDAQWHCLPASAVGAPHQRDRIFILAYPHGAHSKRGWLPSGIQKKQYNTYSNSVNASNLADTNSIRQSGSGESVKSIRAKAFENWKTSQFRPERFASQWETEPRMGRVVNGVSSGVDRSSRLKCLGNAVVPQVAQVLGEYILFLENELNQGG